MRALRGEKRRARINYKVNILEPLRQGKSGGAAGRCTEAGSGLREPAFFGSAAFPTPFSAAGLSETALGSHY